jgi:two-component sensor histidine kinase/putative methionine-R-sulfoxide reductase with GAF domain
MKQATETSVEASGAASDSSQHSAEAAHVQRERQGSGTSTTQVQLAAVREISRAINAAWDLETTLDLITRTTARVMNMDSCSIYLAAPAGTHLVLAATSGLDPSAVGEARLKLGQGLTGWAAARGEPVALDEAADDPRFKYLPETGETRFHSLAAAPLASGEHIVGAINIQTTTTHTFSSDETELLGLVADLAAGALERARLYDDLSRQVRELSTLAEASQTLTGAMYLDEMLQVIVDMAARTMNAANCSLALVEGDSLQLRATQHPNGNGLESAAVGTELLGFVAASGETLVIPDIASDPRSDDADWAVRKGLVSLLAVPLRVRERTIGVLACYTDMRRQFGDDDVKLFTTLANQTALAIENAQLAVNKVVVQEMHHRVKNNLQSIAMLLRLQLGDAKAAGASDALIESMNRILSIAAVHDLLSREGLQWVHVDEIARSVARSVAQTMLADEHGIRVTASGASATLPSQPATAVALIINELVQNAVEHAFDGNHGGEVVVTVEADESELVLRVVDDGAGLPPDFDPAGDGNLGLELVRTLVAEDLHGRFDLVNDGGTTAIVYIPVRW